MNKLSLQATPFSNPAVKESITFTARLSPERSRRMIVLVPPDTECTSLTRRICKIAEETNSDILLLGLYKNAAQELALQRELVTASALIRDAKLFVEMSIEVGTDWLAAVRRNYQAGDTIVCIADQAIGIRCIPLSQMLESTFQAPLYILTEGNPKKPPLSTLSQIFAWSGFVGIVVVFFVLQAQIIALPDNWTKTFLSVLLLIPEIVSIAVWHSLF